MMKFSEKIEIELLHEFHNSFPKSFIFTKRNQNTHLLS